MEIAYYIGLYLHNRGIRKVMRCRARKAVLVLGRFRHERKAVLEAILEELRQRGYLPITLDLESSRDFPVKETLSILIGMSRLSLRIYPALGTIGSNWTPLDKVLLGRRFSHSWPTPNSRRES